MIQFNLLPEAKLDSVKTARTEALALSISIIASLVAVGFLFLSLSLVGLQKHSLSTATSSITSYENQLKSISGLQDILTTQNQLTTLVSLHNQKPLATQLFTYLPQITPTRASISQLVINFDQHTMTISGTADSLASINEFADTLKFTTYSLGSQATNKTAFTSVTLQNFGRDASGASYNFQLTFDPTLFASNQNVTLTVPQNYITTRSFTQLPNSALFGDVSGSSTNSTSGGAH